MTVLQSSRPEMFNQTPAIENKSIVGTTKKDYVVFFVVSLTVKQKQSFILLTST